MPKGLCFTQRGVSGPSMLVGPELNNHDPSATHMVMDSSKVMQSKMKTHSIFTKKELGAFLPVEAHSFTWQIEI